MRDYYTLKEIVFGLRKEQLRICRELKLLEPMLVTHGDWRYDGSFFSNILDYGNRLNYRLIVNHNISEKLFNLITKGFWGSEIHSLVYTSQDEDGNYKINFQGRELVKPEKQVEFNEKVNSILKDSFVNAGGIGENVQEHRHIYICSYSSDYFDYDNDKRLYYHPREDVLLVDFARKYKGAKLEEIVTECLDVKIPRSLIPEYYQSIIDGNDDTKKDIIIPDTKFKKIDKFYLNEEPNAFVLVKK